LRPGRRRLLDTLLPRLRVGPLDDRTSIDLGLLFPALPRRLWLEVGFGAGEHLAAQAAAHPEIGIIGCEPFVNGVAALLSLVDRMGLANVRVFDDDARPLLAALPAAAIDRVFVLFPDPWPKRRHHKRRFIAPPTLDALARVMGDGAELRFASDDMDYVRWTLDHVCRHGAFAWTARRPGDWRGRPGDAVETRYEAKARAAGTTCVHLTFRRRPR
jgi:tRNA (guanine-N7-)-methyltransferase